MEPANGQVNKAKKADNPAALISLMIVANLLQAVAGGGGGGDETTSFKGLSLRVHESRQILKRLGDDCDKLMSHLTNAGRFITKFAEGVLTKMTVDRRHRISADLTVCGLGADCDGCGKYVNSVLISPFDEQSFHVEPYTDLDCMFSGVNLCVVFV